MKKCIVIGGGFAGLSAAAFLINSGINVELIEASQKLGGRAYSFYDKYLDTIIDNGQHIMMGCYRETLRFFQLIGAADNLIYQKNLSVLFVKEGFKIFPLEAAKLFYPLNLVSALLKYRAISFYDRVKLLKFFSKLYLFPDRDLEKMNVYDWLVQENQNENLRKAFWEILAIGALNTNIKKASAKVFSDILKEIFLKGNKAASIILPRFGLSETYCNHAKKFIEEKGGVVNLSEQILGFEIADNNIKSIKTSRRLIKDFDSVISAVPPFAFKNIIPEKNNVPSFEYSSILSCHIKLKGQNNGRQFYGFINSKIHWVFNNGDHITVVISDANGIIDESKEDLFEMISAELFKFLKIDRTDIISYKIVKEKRATFIPSMELISRRPRTETSFQNLYLAGDWVDTKLPSTIESAVKSGRLAAKKIK